MLGVLLAYILADTEAVKVGLMAANLVVTVVLGIGLFVLNRKAALTDQRAKRMELSEDRLQQLAEKLVEERFRSFSHEVRGQVNSFMLAMEEFKVRMKDAELVFDQLGKADHAAELKQLQKMEQIKDYIRDHTASKQDVQRHEQAMQQKVEQIGTQINDLRTSVALMAEKCKD